MIDDFDDPRTLTTIHVHDWTYHQPATCGATPVWSCEGPRGCGRWETTNPNPEAGPTIVTSTPWAPEPLKPHVVQSQACANCGEPMDMEKVVWWCPNGVVCKESCAREFTEKSP